MCCFTGKVRRVSGTQIFARRDGSIQALIYAMSVDIAAELAMVLPLPTPPGAGLDAVEFIDLEQFPDCFSRLESLFPVLRRSAKSRTLGAPQSRSVLPVVQVGQFEASYVPSMSDFDRLDARFRISAHSWSAVPSLSDYGFAIFKLRRGAQRVHPMALRFSTRLPDETFFPTLHLHDGTIPAVASFDHALYLQASAIPRNWMPQGVRAPSYWRRLTGVLSTGGLPGASPRQWETADALPDRAMAQASKGLVAPSMPMYRLRLGGRLANTDTVVGSGPQRS